MVDQSAGIVLWSRETSHTSGSHQKKALKSIHAITNLVSPAPFSAPDIMTSAASKTCHAAISTKSLKPSE